MIIAILIALTVGAAIGFAVCAFFSINKED